MEGPRRYIKYGSSADHIDLYATRMVDYGYETTDQAIQDELAGIYEILEDIMFDANKLNLGVSGLPRTYAIDFEVGNELVTNSIKELGPDLTNGLENTFLLSKESGEEEDGIDYGRYFAVVKTLEGRYGIAQASWYGGFENNDCFNGIDMAEAGARVTRYDIDYLLSEFIWLGEDSEIRDGAQDQDEN